MSKNRFYTILIIPEKTQQVRKFLIPGWLFRGSAAGIAFALLIGFVMLLDYWYVMSQIGENKQLKMENRRLRQQVQVFKNKITTVESTMDRVKTFATRLKVITNIEDRSGLLQSLNSDKLPDAATNIPGPDTPNENQNTEAALIAAQDSARDPDDSGLKKEYLELDEKFSELNHSTLGVEQELQDLYELLSDQKSFLAALPTKKPAIGYFTSGFGIRKSPYGGRIKMHEGLDIANRPGTVIKSPADGVVLFSDAKAGYGQTVIIDHGYGVETWYGHASKLIVTKGQKVRRGETIALLGNSGRSTGPHVHYEVRVRGLPVDPISFLLEN
ncbi:MAG: M23 family metallopeptidase [Bdellovibrionota bacterium]